MTRETVRMAGCLALFVLLAATAGCLPVQQVPEFHARIDPPRGHVPYEARILCTPLGGTYTYELPDGSVISGAGSELDVVIDLLSWEAKVTWTNGKTVLVGTVTAQGTNALPRILPPRINGNPEMWYLEPRERTLIDFTHYERTLAGPETGVDYDGEWRVIEIRLECPLKKVCQDVVPDSVFCPPYSPNTYRALFNGRLFDNACIVYPTYTGEIAPNGLPYAPAPEEGYTYDAYRVRGLYYAVTFPEQTGRIHVTVEDDWGRRTGTSFEIPVGPLVWTWEYGPPTDYTDAVVYVAAKNSALYHRSTCPEVCSIATRNRVYFCEQRSAVDSGRTPSADCF